MDDLSGLKKAFNDVDMQVVSFIELLLADQPTGVIGKLRFKSSLMEKITNYVHMYIYNLTTE